ncbi:MAG TPA: hypothetical protein VEC06_09520 [Paucimonas sp.]|nr:hypothetical protein [Paucimonas sp.]
MLDRPCAAFAQDRPDSAALLAQARAAIERGSAQWKTEWEKGDAAIFSDHAVLLTGKGQLFKDRQRIRERQQALMHSIGAGVTATVTTIDVWVDGDWKLVMDMVIPDH